MKGSETLRGKVIILFGPPSEIKQTAGEGSMGRPATVDRAEVTSGVPDAHGNVGPGTAGPADEAYPREAGGDKPRPYDARARKRSLRSPSFS